MDGFVEPGGVKEDLLDSMNGNDTVDPPAFEIAPSTLPELHLAD